jgi:tyrosine-protein phosphatase YwqE
MLSIFKKTLPPPPDLSGLVTDMHSHIIPGIDDGSTDVETSIELIRGLTGLGYKKFIATPHILWDIYKNDDSTIRPAYTELQQALKENNMDVSVSFAAEYFLDDHIDDLIEQEIPLLTIKKNWVLTEFSFVSAPLDLKEKLFALQISGYQPIVAHPERYGYFSRDRKVYDDLKEAGYYFQVNLLSLTGYYGKGPQELAEYLVKKKYVDLLGTDLHHLRHLQSLQTNPQLTDIIKELQDSGKLLNASL